LKPEASAVVLDYTSRTVNSAAGKQFLGSWLLHIGELIGARAAFEESKRIDPNSTAADFGLVQIAVLEGEFDAARDLLTGILKRDPRNVRALFSLGEVEDKANQSGAAIGYYDQVLSEDHDNVLALNNLAYVLADTGTDPDRALALAQKAKEVAPENTAINDTIGWAYYSKGLFQAALDYLGKAANGTPLTKCHFAMAYTKLGYRQQASAILRTVLKEDPNLPEAQKLSNSLRKCAERNESR
jgi:tetratricopeptide (TPR) repeat protein